MKNDQKGPPAANSGKFQIPSDLVVKSQASDIIDLILQLVGHPNGVHRPCRNRKSRGAVLSTSEGQWATTKFDGVWEFLCLEKSHKPKPRRRVLCKTACLMPWGPSTGRVPFAPVVISRW